MFKGSIDSCHNLIRFTYQVIQYNIPPPQWRGALMFSLICAWINGWINNRWFETPSCLLWRHCNEFPQPVQYHCWLNVNFVEASIKFYVKIRSFSLTKLWFQNILRKMTATRILYGCWSMFKKWEAATFPNIDVFYLQLTYLFVLSLCKKQSRRSHGRAQVAPCSTPLTQSFHLLIPVPRHSEAGWNDEAGHF